MNKKQLRISLFIMVALCILTYVNHFENAFHFDDSHVVQNNAYIRSLKNIPLFFKDGSTSSTLPQNQSYRPVVSTSLAFDYWLGGGYDLFFFHLSSFILFVLQGVLMVFLVNKILMTAIDDNKLSIYTALIATTWYLLHPAIAETVNYVSARSDLQSTFFVVLAFVLYLYSPFWRKTHLYNLLIVIGALAKPPAIMFAPLLFFYVLFFEEKLSLPDVFKRQYIRQVLNIIKNVLPAFICCAALYYFQDRMTPKTWEPGGTSPVQYLITQPFVILHYFAMYFVPNDLSADSDWTLLPGIMNWRFFAGCAFVLVMIAIAFITSRKALLRPISFGIMWFFIALAPTSSIIPLAEVMNDHRMYFPFVGLCISVSWTLALMVNKYLPVIVRYKTAALVLLAISLSGYAYGTYQRNRVWHTEESLWQDVTVKSPANGRGLMNYGLTQMSKGNYQAADLYFSQALKLLPNYFTLHINLGILKGATRHPAEAEQYFKKAIVLGATFPDSYLFYGRYLKDQKRYPEAIELFKKALALSPAYLYNRMLLMDTYQAVEDWDELKTIATSTLQLVPDNPEVLNYLDASNKRAGKIEIAISTIKKSPTAEKYLELGMLYYNAGRYEQCIDACKQAIKLKANLPEAYNNMGAAYNLLRQYDKAIGPLKKALALKPDFELAKNNLLYTQQQLLAAKK
jgi:tetratricopeptide (TPR) repeat protein